jgi:Calcium-activated chloride channel/Cytosolic domain of 10TM putative phosphate transporter
LNELQLKIVKEPLKYAWGIAFITFQTKKIADLVETKWGYNMGFSLSNILKLFQTNKKYIYHRNGAALSTDIKVERAPNPNDIIWPNLGLGWFSLICRTFTTYLTTAILLGLSFGALVGLKVLQFNMSQGTDNSSSGTFKFRAISVCISLVITIINQMLGKSIKSLTHTEKHATLTAYFQSLVIKVVAVSGVVT